MADNAAIEAAMAAAKARIEHSELPPGHSMSPGMQGVQGGLDKEEEADPDDLFNRLEKHTTKGIEADVQMVSGNVRRLWKFAACHPHHCLLITGRFPPQGKPLR